MTGRGRSAYEPSDKDRRIVEMIAGWAIPEHRIANVLSIDPKTLREHYRSELDVGHSKLEAQLAQNLLRIAQGHDRQALIATIFALKTGSVGSRRTPPPKDPPQGKKEQMRENARRAGEGSSRWATCSSQGQHQRVG